MAATPQCPDFKKRTSIAYVSADIAAQHGIVIIQVHTIQPAAPRPAAFNRRKDPAPIIDPVMVWGFLTGTPKKEAI